MKLVHPHRHQPRHARPRTRRRPRSASAWVGVLVLAGMAMSPEPSAPAAQLSTRPVAAAAVSAPVVRPASVTTDEPHGPWRSSAPGEPAPAPFVGTRWGTDIGWPQCGHALPDIAVDFTIVQVTAGRPGTVSPCLEQQVAWARSVRSVLNAYVVPGSPSAADLAAADRSGSCRGDRSCRLRAAGAADAAHALAGAEAAGLEARGWWLDVEDVAARTLWGTDTDANTQVLIGWRDELRRAGKQVGVYSTRGYWRQIVGHWQAGLPQWPAVGLAGVDAAKRACGRPFTSGPVLVTQWLTGPLDGNVLCPDRDALAAAFFGHFTRAHTAGVPALLVIPVPHPDIEAALRAQAELEARQAELDKKAEEAAAAKAKAKAKARAEAEAKARARKSQQAAATATTHQPTEVEAPAPQPAEAEPAAPGPEPAEPSPEPTAERSSESTPPDPGPTAGTG